MGADKSMIRCVSANARGSLGRDDGPSGRRLVSTLPGVVLHIVLGVATATFVICATVADEETRPPDAVNAVLVDGNLTMGGKG